MDPSLLTEIGHEWWQEKHVQIHADAARFKVVHAAAKHYLSFAFTSDFAATNVSTTAVCSLFDAKCRGMSPSLTNKKE
jgi:hypothetical protein